MLGVQLLHALVGFAGAQTFADLIVGNQRSTSVLPIDVDLTTKLRIAKDLGAEPVALVLPGSPYP